MRHLHHLLLGGLILLLAGCAGFGPRETLEGTGDPARWAEHRQQVATLDGWQITGKVGLRVPPPGESGSATLFWLQRQDYFDIRLSGPLGGGAARLTGRAEAATLEVAGQGRFEASSPQALLADNLGWSLPVEHLLWWVRGLPAPDSRSRLTLDGEGRLARLEQDGWRIEYPRYAEHQGYWLPERIKLSGQDLEVTLVLKEWQPRRLGQ